MAEESKVATLAPPAAQPAPAAVDPDEQRVFTADEILAVEDLKPVFVSVPEWGKGGIYLRLLSAFEGNDLSEDMGPNGNAKGGSVKVLLRCACDKNGNKIFTEAQLNRLKQKSMKVINRLALHALHVNGLLKESAAKELELTKND